jgi:hypothetical protein
MVTLQMSGKEFLLASGAYVASDMGVTMDAGWGGAKGFFGGGDIILLKITGNGKIVAPLFCVLAFNAPLISKRQAGCIGFSTYLPRRLLWQRFVIGPILN